MVFPFAIMIFANEKDCWSRILNIIVFGTVVAAIMTMFYYPIYTIYGKEMFRFPVGGRPPLSELSQIFGNLGVLAMISLLLVSLIHKLKPRFISNFKTILRKNSRENIEIWLTIVVIYTILYLDMPHEPAYLIPALPFFIMVILPFFNANLFKAATIFIILSSFIDIGANSINT
jgi:hypothetical protein